MDFRGFPVFLGKSVLYFKWRLLYVGGRTSGDIVNWLTKKIGPAAKALNTVDEVKEFVDATDVSLVGFFQVS